MSRPRIDVVGLGPAGPELITAATLGADGRGRRALPPHPPAPGRRRLHRRPPSFDHHYEAAETFDEVYRAIVEDLVAAAAGRRAVVVYAVPGSPTVAERTVVLLRRAPRVVDGAVRSRCTRRCPSSIWPSTGWGSTRWPPASGWSTARSFAVDAAGERGPLLVAQCWSRRCSPTSSCRWTTPPADPVTVLHHLGLADEGCGRWRGTSSTGPSRPTT